jgi:Flp pilus assembly protein TadG
MDDRSRERGQSLVELALALPILLMITMGVLDLGRAYFAYTTIANAAREGAMCASLSGICTAGPAATVTAEVSGTLPGGVTTTVTGGASPGSSVTVTVRHDFQLVTRAILGLQSMPIRASATVVVQ